MRFGPLLVIALGGCSQKADRPTPDANRPPPRYAIGMFSVLNDAFGAGDPRVHRAYLGLWAAAQGLADLVLGGMIPGDALAFTDEVLAQHIASVRALAASAP